MPTLFLILTAALAIISFRAVADFLRDLALFELINGDYSHALTSSIDPTYEFEMNDILYTRYGELTRDVIPETGWLTTKHELSRICSGHDPRPICINRRRLRLDVGCFLIGFSATFATAIATYCLATI